MASSTRIYLRAGDTEPFDLIISATGLSDLDELTTAVFYVRMGSSATNHVDGAALTVKDSSTRTLTFDPAGNKSGGGDAFDAAGIYRGYVLVTWSDGDETRHPGGPGLIRIDVTENYE